MKVFMKMVMYHSVCRCTFASVNVVFDISSLPDAILCITTGADPMLSQTDLTENLTDMFFTDNPAAAAAVVIALQIIQIIQTIRVNLW